MTDGYDPFGFEDESSNDGRKRPGPTQWKLLDLWRLTFGRLTRRRRKASEMVKEGRERKRTDLR